MIAEIVDLNEYKVERGKRYIPPEKRHLIHVKKVIYVDFPEARKWHLENKLELAVAEIFDLIKTDELIEEGRLKKVLEQYQSVRKKARKVGVDTARYEWMLSGFAQIGS